VVKIVGIGESLISTFFGMKEKKAEKKEEAPSMAYEYYVFQKTGEVFGFLTGPWMLYTFNEGHMQPRYDGRWDNVVV
jgi:hypothetical protein